MPHGQQPYGQQPYGQQPGAGDGIALTLKFFPLSFFFLMTKPVVTLNGHPVVVPWSRRTVIPTPPGTYHVHVHVPYIMPSRVGSADLPVQVGGGRPVELEYRAPAWTFSPGSLGAPPQKYNGMVVTWILLAIPLLVLLACCANGVISGLAADGSGS